MASPVVIIKKQHALSCSGHTRPVIQLSFSGRTADGSCFLVSASKDGRPMLRHGDTGDWVGTFEGHKGAVWAATLNREASLAATGSADFTAKVWNAVTGNELMTLSHRHIVKCVEFSGDSNYLLTGGNEKTLRVFDLNKAGGSPEIITCQNSNIKKCLWVDERTILSSAEDRTIKLWDMHNKLEIRNVRLKSAANDLEISHDREIVTVAYSNKVAFFTRNLEVVKEFEVSSPLNSASLHPSGDVIVCAGDDFKIYKVHYKTGQELESYKGHFGAVHSTRFSPDGELYASGSEDGTLRLWQTTVGKTYDASSVKTEPIYMGCNRQQLHERVLQGKDDEMTVSMCAIKCRALAYTYSGLMIGSVCYCGQDFGTTGMLPDARCADPCTGNANDKYCGGVSAVAVYTSCPPGWYGVNCLGICKCAGLMPCHIQSGKCDGGEETNVCAPGWEGSSCNIEMGNVDINLYEYWFWWYQLAFMIFSGFCVIPTLILFISVVSTMLSR